MSAINYTIKYGTLRDLILKNITLPTEQSDWLSHEDVKKLLLTRLRSSQNYYLSVHNNFLTENGMTKWPAHLRSTLKSSVDKILDCLSN